MAQFCIFWIVLVAAFLIIEAAAPALVSIWFAGGGCVAMAAAIAGAGFLLQFILFLVVSALAIAGTRPVAKKRFNLRREKTNAESALGKTGIVAKGINNDAAEGTVLLSGMEWSARSESGEKIEAGKKVKVSRIEGVKLIVNEEEGEKT